MNLSRSDIEFTGCRAVAAEGARVGIITCLECGAAILLDPADERDVVQIHRSWHGSIVGERDAE